MYNLRIGQAVFLITFSTSTSLFSETVNSITITSHKKDIVYLMNWLEQTVIEPNYEEACNAIGGYWGILPWKNAEFACYSQSWNSTIIGTDTYYCADGSLAYTNTPANTCYEFKVCPNSSWTLSNDKLHCSRPDKTCHVTPNDVQEFQLLAAIIYSEASATANSYEEKAAIGKAALRRRDAWGVSRLQQLIAKKPGSFYGVSSKNPRYMNIMCLDLQDIQVEYPQVYDAVLNAYDPNAIDYSNGGCLWDGKDLRSGKDHPHFKFYGYYFTDPSHNLWPDKITTTPPKNWAGDYPNDTNPLHYDWKLESTAAWGETIFFKTTQQYLNAYWGATPCK